MKTIAYICTGLAWLSFALAPLFLALGGAERCTAAGVWPTKLSAPHGSEPRW